jgi:hypothetical protein
VSVRAAGVAPSGVDPVEPVVFGGEASGVLGVDGLGVDALAGGVDAVALELVVGARRGDVPLPASQ